MAKIYSLEEEILRLEGKLAESRKFPITITVESQKMGKKVYKTNAFLLTATSKKGAFTHRVAEECKGFDYIKCVVQHVDSIDEILKDADGPVNTIVLSMLEDILNKYKK